MAVASRGPTPQQDCFVKLCRVLSVALRDRERPGQRHTLSMPRAARSTRRDSRSTPTEPPSGTCARSVVTSPAPPSSRRSHRPSSQPRRRRRLELVGPADAADAHPPAGRQGFRRETDAAPARRGRVHGPGEHRQLRRRVRLRHRWCAEPLQAGGWRRGRRDLRPVDMGSSDAHHRRHPDDQEGGQQPRRRADAAPARSQRVHERGQHRQLRRRSGATARSPPRRTSTAPTGSPRPRRRTAARSRGRSCWASDLWTLAAIAIVALVIAAVLLLIFLL